MTDSEKICLAVFDQVLKPTSGQIELSVLGDAESVVVLVVQVYGLGVNMGLNSMLSDEIDGDPGYRLATASFERIGAGEVAAILTEALRLVSCNPDPESDDSSCLNELEGRFYELERETFERLAVFIRQDEFLNDFAKRVTQ